MSLAVSTKTEVQWDLSVRDRRLASAAQFELSSTKQYSPLSPVWSVSQVGFDFMFSKVCVCVWLWVKVDDDRLEQWQGTEFALLVWA